MRFLFRHRFGPYRVALSIGRVTDVEGINSDLVSGGHIVMWEFDSPDDSAVRQALLMAQKQWDLPDIIMAQSHLGGGFHAYCFKRVTWLHSLSIVANTEGVDEAWINLCAMRNHWTLRLTDKGQGPPEYFGILHGHIPVNCSMLDLARHVKYEAHTTKKIWGFGLRERATIAPGSDSRPL